MPLDTEGAKLLEHILDHNKPELFPVLADHLEENHMPKLAEALRNYTPLRPGSIRYADDDGNVVPNLTDKHREILKSPQVIPNVHLVPHGRGYLLHDMRGFKYPEEDEEMLSQGLDDEEAADRRRNLAEEFEKVKPVHYFHSSQLVPGYTEGSVRWKRDKLELAKPLPVYEDPGDEVHITGLSKGGNCEHCGKPDIYRIHVKHPVSGETCKIGSSCASGMLRDNSKKNLTGKMQPKDILHKAATAESLKDVGSVVKVRLKNKDTKLKLSRSPEELWKWVHHNQESRDELANHLDSTGHPELAKFMRSAKYETTLNPGKEGKLVIKHSTDATVKPITKPLTHPVISHAFIMHHPDGTAAVMLRTPHMFTPERRVKKSPVGVLYAHVSDPSGLPKLQEELTKLKLSRGISVEPDTHSQEEIYAALVAEGVEPTKAQELSHALS